MLRWLLELAYHPIDGFVCLYCGRHGHIESDSEYVIKHTCAQCDEFYEVGEMGEKYADIYFSIRDFRLACEPWIVGIDGMFSLFRIETDGLTRLTTIPAFRPDFSDRQALRDKIAGYLNFL